MYQEAAAKLQHFLRLAPEDDPRKANAEKILAELKGKITK
jgi:cytochrome c-type biogenesis protein CcmH/NrfG